MKQLKSLDRVFKNSKGKPFFIIIILAMIYIFRYYRLYFTNSIKGSNLITDFFSIFACGILL